jgi:hypothetical protein
MTDRTIAHAVERAFAAPIEGWASTPVAASSWNGSVRAPAP